jgi:hypothetical protein
MEAKLQVEDWQLGNDSSLSPLTRIDFMNDWLKKNKQEILLKKEKNKPEDAEEFLGFIDIE